MQYIRFPLNATPLNEKNPWFTTIRSFLTTVHNVAPRSLRTERTTHPRSPAATFPTRRSVPRDAFADSHRAHDVSRPTFPVVPLFPASPPPISRPASPTVSHSHDFPHPRHPGRWDARPLHGIYARENIDVVAVFFVHHRLFRRLEPCHPAKRAYARRAVSSPSTSGRLMEEGGKERALSSVLTSVDPIPEADPRRASDVAPTETKSRNAAGDGRADVVKEATICSSGYVSTHTHDGGCSRTRQRCHSWR